RWADATAPGRLKNPRSDLACVEKGRPMMSKCGAANSLHPPLEGEGRCEHQRAAGRGERLAVGITPPPSLISLRSMRAEPPPPGEGEACLQQAHKIDAAWRRLLRALAPL